MSCPAGRRVENQSVIPSLAEFLGTALLIILGDGVLANVLLKGSKGQGSGWIVITSGWAFAVFCTDPAIRSAPSNRPP